MKKERIDRYITVADDIEINSSQREKKFGLSLIFKHKDSGDDKERKEKE